MHNLICISLLFLAGVLNVYAQDYNHLVREGAWWAGRSYYGDVPSISANRAYSFHCDTIIDGKVYKILRNGFNEFGSHAGYYREQDKKVYQYLSTQEEIMVYDFNLEIGDTVQYNAPTWYTYGDGLIVGIDEIELNDGSTVKQYCIEHYGNDYYCMDFNITEQLGSSSGGLFHYYGITWELFYSFFFYGYGVYDDVLYYGHPAPPQYEQYVQDVMDYFDTLYIENPNYICKNYISNNSPTLQIVNLYPNPTYQHIKVESTKTLKRMLIYDFNGQLKLSSTTTQLNVSQLKPGRYIAQIQMIDGTISNQHFVKQ